jgi:hypothetical protein
MSSAGRQRAALLAARRRRIQLDVDRVAKEQRADQATAEVLLRQQELDDAEAAATRVRVGLGRALQRLLAEVDLDRAAALSGLKVTQLKALVKLAAREQQRTPPVESGAQSSGAA